MSHNTCGQPRLLYNLSPSTREGKRESTSEVKLPKMAKIDRETQTDPVTPTEVHFRYELEPTEVHFRYELGTTERRVTLSKCADSDVYSSRR